MEGEITRTLARFAAELDHNRIPEQTAERCKDLLLDTLACALAGHKGEETSQIAGLATALGASRESSVIGGDRLSLAGATLLNGYLVTAVTMCDIHRPTLTHVTPEVMPPALAIAEQQHANGRDLLAALAAGLEVTTRIGVGLNPSAFRSRGWHGPGVIGPFGSAAAAGHLLGLDADTMAAAFGLAGSQSAGTFAAWGTPTVKFHQCRGALSGLMAALLAQQGFVATREFLTAPDGGLFNTFSDGGNVGVTVGGLGDRWELEQIALRLWPSASTIQGMITAVFDLVENNDIRPDEVRQVRVALSKTAFNMHGGFDRYKAKFEALLSAHYSTAIVLHDRELTLDQFEPARYDDPQLRRFSAEQVQVRPDDGLSGIEAAVEVEMADGRVLSAHCDTPKGAPGNPLSRAEIEGKFRRYAQGVISPAATEEAIQMVSQLERLESVHELLDALRAS
jgi:2-methylcitrate dehydratase PrpD